MKFLSLIKELRKTLIIIIIAVIVIFIAGSAYLAFSNKVEKTDIITSSDLEEAVMISELSSAEYVYNGVAEKTDDGDPDEIVCYIAYNATVKVGIDMEDVSFEIDDEAKSVTVILPEIAVNIASIDEDSLSYIPQDPDVSLKEIIRLCKEDAIQGAQESGTLYDTAEENLKSVIEALLSPLLEKTEYSLLWVTEESGFTTEDETVEESGTATEDETAEESGTATEDETAEESDAAS